jgi:hypothetical protein
MYINLEDIAFWMDAIRNSENPYGTLESFWKGQLKSKEWLVNHLHKYISVEFPEIDVVIHGGWNGVLASLLYNSGIAVRNIRSIDIDINCEEIANTINKRQEMVGLFKAITEDMCLYDYEYEPHIVINTSTEHITQEQYETWLDKVPANSLIVLQNNNYYDLDEHIRCFDSVDTFVKSSRLSTILEANTLNLPMYDRFLIIGHK